VTLDVSICRYSVEFETVIRDRLDRLL